MCYDIPWDGWLIQEPGSDQERSDAFGWLPLHMVPSHGSCDFVDYSKRFQEIERDWVLLKGNLRS